MIISFLLEGVKCLMAGYANEECLRVSGGSKGRNVTGDPFTSKISGNYNHKECLGISRYLEISCTLSVIYSFELFYFTSFLRYYFSSFFSFLFHDTKHQFLINFQWNAQYQWRDKRREREEKDSQNRARC